MRAVVLDEAGQPGLADVAEPDGDGALVRVLACGLCGSDVEKIGAAPAGTVLGHEVTAELDGRRVALVHHLPCGECDRCLAGHESTCDAFRAATIVPGGFAERAHATETLDLPDAVDDATATYVEPLACVLRAVERLPGGRVLVVGNGFVGRLFGAVLERRGDEVFATDLDPRRSGRATRRPGRRRGALRTRRGDRGSRDARPRGHAARLRPLRPARARRRLPPRADRDRLALGHASPHARGDRAPAPPRRSPSRPCSRSSGSPRGSSSTAPATR